MRAWLWRLFPRRENYVSSAWLKEQDYRETTETWREGVSIRWPIRKLLNESTPAWNAKRLKEKQR